MILTNEDLEKFKQNIEAHPREFSYDDSTFKFTYTQGGLTFSMSRESFDDIYAYPAWNYMLTKKVIKDWDGKKILVESIYEELCCIEFHRQQLGRNPDGGMYSEDSSITQEFKLNAIAFSLQMVTKMHEHIFGKKVDIS